MRKPLPAMDRVTRGSLEKSMPEVALAKAQRAIPEPYWTKRITWYPDGCFGPYRSAATGYSRRELAADATVHAVGCMGGTAGAVLLIHRVLVADTPLVLVIGIVVYALSLLSMLFCSAVFNIMVAQWGSHRWELQLADHLGILLLIAGSYTPFMIHACCPQTLAFVWMLGSISFVAKASRSFLDMLVLHVLCFLSMGWACMASWDHVVSSQSPWAIGRMVLGGCLYTSGLLPWACNRLEFHK